MSSSQSKQDFTLLKSHLNLIEDALKRSEYLAGVSESIGVVVRYALLDQCYFAR